MRIKNLLVISACDSSMSSWGNLWIDQIQKFNVDWKIFDLGGFHRGAPVDFATRELTEPEPGRQRSDFKPRLILQVLRRFRRPVLWLNPDAFLVQHLHDVLARVDLAVTVNRPEEWNLYKRNGHNKREAVDAGVIFANPTPASEQFIHKWAALADEQNDQAALNLLFKEITYRNAVGNVSGARVRLLSTEIYNSHYFTEKSVMEKAKILHFKGDHSRIADAASYGINGSAGAANAATEDCKLRVGQRGTGKNGWLHLDSHPSADIVSEIPPLPASVTNRMWQIIEGIHVWEHFHKWEAEKLARCFHDVLAPGGKLVLECPNLEIACRSLLGGYKDSNSYHMHVFYGDPQHEDPAYGHRWGYTPESLKHQLIEFGGFQADDVCIEPAQFHVRDRDFRIVARKR
ncbi:methyltransferase domain-containing protein [Gimesia panareensis]|uniref:methyltransferase domain-containing protein n=1 Tax=Gimesia panareensis TaxID=2527978 RepID=UPI00118A7889|nr:methyltransferase domain-containing protein [Gimesia panareensis]QDU49570.1 Nucleotide-diphospho-sugar transferase [Gimesia panareensis]